MNDHVLFKVGHTNLQNDLIKSNFCFTHAVPEENQDAYRRKDLPQSLHVNASGCIAFLFVSSNRSLALCLIFPFSLFGCGALLVAAFCRGLCHRRCDAKLAGQLNTF